MMIFGVIFLSVAVLLIKDALVADKVIYKNFLDGHFRNER